MSELQTDMIAGFGGTKLAIHRLGSGRPVLMLHGLFSSAQMNWIRFGHAQRVADAGFEAIMPDFRAHGESEAPHDPQAYPPDVLVRDLEAIVAHLSLSDFDLVGFSLGARTCARAVVEGLPPRRLILAGMGLQGLAGWDRRAAFFIDAIDRFAEVKQGDPAFLSVQFMKTMKVDRVAARLLLQSVEDLDATDLKALSMRTRVICGDKDDDNGDPHQLVEALPDASFEEIPGTHMSSVTGPELGESIVRFLAA